MNYFKLKLPKNPLNDNFVPVTNGSEGWHIYKNVKDVLNSELFECLGELGVCPSMAVIFGSNNSHRTSGFLHVDLGEHYEVTWKPVPCAINWELGETVSRIEWHDTSNYNELWPEDVASVMSYPNNYLHAVSYTKKESPTGLEIIKENVPAETLVDTTTLTNDNSPMLINTSRPHGVLYKSKSAPRFALSIRFGFHQIETWEQAVEIFSPIMIDN